MKKVVLLGASGSIGTQTIDVISNHQDEFELVAFSVGYNIKMVHELIQQFPRVKIIIVANEDDALYLRTMYPHITIYFGNQGLIELAKGIDYDIFVSAIVGFRGLEPLLEAVKHCSVIALANKESLVTGGRLVKQACQQFNVKLYPIDSEHSAIFQCLQGNKSEDIDKLIITASGGSFRDKSRDELVNVSREEALNHPNWKMGGRITIDSATMCNKAFEIIEAHYLFDIPFEKIDVIIHKESVVHSMVQYKDHSIIAQIGTADMRIPIQYALSYPNRLEMKASEPFDFINYPELHFCKPDFERYPLLKMAYIVGEKGGNLGAIMNGADEEAVELFLTNKIKFLDIEEYVIEAIQSLLYIEDPTLQDLIDSDKMARMFVRQKYELTTK